MVNKDKIIARALVRMGINAPEDLPTAAQRSQVDNVLTSIHEDWVDQNVVRWELDSIPASLANAVVTCAAYKCANDFALSDQRYNRLAIDYELSMESITAYNQRFYSGTAPIQEF